MEESSSSDREDTQLIKGLGNVEMLHVGTGQVRVLQHFNICPSQLAPNGRGILVGLLASFRDKGLGIPSLALFLHLFRPNETTEGFLYFSRLPELPR